MLLISCSNRQNGQYQSQAELKSVAQRNQSISSMHEGSGYDQQVLKITPEQQTISC